MQRLSSRAEPAGRRSACNEGLARTTAKEKKLNEQQRMNWLKAKGGAMRATSAEVLAAKQLRDAEGAVNAGMRPVPGMQNMWATDPDAWAPPAKRPTLFARLMRWFCAG